MATHARYLPAAPPRVDQRRSERQPVSVSLATVREIGQDARDARLLDLSAYGCRMAMSGDQDEDARVWLRFDGGWPIAATVIWARNDMVGCRFDDPIPGALMRELTRALN